MRTAPISIAATPDVAHHHEKISAFFAVVASSTVFAGKLVLALPAFALAAVVFSLHLILPSEKHW